MTTKAQCLVHPVRVATECSRIELAVEMAGLLLLQARKRVAWHPSNGGTNLPHLLSASTALARAEELRDAWHKMNKRDEQVAKNRVGMLALHAANETAKIIAGSAIASEVERLESVLEGKRVSYGEEPMPDEATELEELAALIAAKKAEGTPEDAPAA